VRDESFAQDNSDSER